MIVITIDLKKAFDTIDHRVLRVSLQKKNILGKLRCAIMGKYFNRRARIKASGDGGSTVKGSWWREVSIGCTQGGVDSMELLTAMVDDLEDELARARIRGVQFSVNNAVRFR